VRLIPEEVVALDMATPRCKSEYLVLVQREIKEFAGLPPIDTVYHCGGGMGGFAINAFGEIGICIISQQETFNVRTAGVKTVWEGSLLQLRNRKRTRVTKCATCRLHSLCTMCPANGEMENGDKESPVEFLCHVAHLRAASLGVDIPEHGDCEFCAGGVQHEEVLESARRIANREVDVESWAGPQHVLPILNNATPIVGGCANCSH
jgi:radical SAM protein with 4Fe4S-binding SPASM domain